MLSIRPFPLPQGNMSDKISQNVEDYLCNLYDSTLFWNDYLINEDTELCNLHKDYRN